MATSSLNLIDFSAAAFDPSRIMAVKHRLSEHPLLSLPALMNLAARLPRKQVRFHAVSARASSSFERAEIEHPHGGTVHEALANMATSGSWIALHNAQTDPMYAGLLNEALDEVEERIGKKDPGMFHRAFWLFIQSPGSVTPFHMDHEQNFLMQIQGRKVARVWHPEDCLTERGLETFLAENSRRDAPYDPAFNASAQTFLLTPGQGVYMPATCPHLVNNTDNVSITVSMTYCTKATQRRETVSRANAKLRRLGLRPKRIGESRAADSVKNMVLGTAIMAKDLARGKDPRVPYWAR